MFWILPLYLAYLVFKWIGIVYISHKTGCSLDECRAHWENRTVADLQKERRENIKWLIIAAVVALILYLMSD